MNEYLCKDLSVGLGNNPQSINPVLTFFGISSS